MIIIKKIWQHKNIKESFLGALRGLIFVLSSEYNAKRIFIIGLLVLFFAWLLKLSLLEKTIIIAVVTAVFVGEIINTLIEKILDLIQPNYDLQVKILKDIASGAVLITSFSALIIGILIFGPKLLEFF